MNRAHSEKTVFDEIIAFNADCDPDLVQRKLKRLDDGAFPFFRGTDHLFGRAWREHPSG
jgi:uncharacterized protein (DUF2252 family)